MNKEKNTTWSRRRFISQAAAVPAFFIVPRFVLGGKGYTAPSDLITLGCIGAGRQAVSLQKSFLKTEEVKIIAVCDPYKAKADSYVQQVNAFYAEQAGQPRYEGCRQHTNFTELLAQKDIDAVVIATPDHWHAAMVVRAARAGKDIYSEKPLSLTVQEGRAMVDAVNKYNRVFQTGSMQRSMPEFRQAVELIRNGYLGTLKTVQVSIGGPPVEYNLPEEPLPAGLNWNEWLGPNEYVHFNHQLNPVLGDSTWGRWRDFKRLGGGDMTDWGAHMFDIVQWALDMDRSGPEEIIPPDNKGIAALTYKYHSGVTVTKEDFGKKHAIRFTGSGGQLEIQRGKLLTEPEGLKDKVIGGNDKRVYFSANHYKDFLDAIRRRTKPVSDIETGHRKRHRMQYRQHCIRAEPSLEMGAREGKIY